MRLDKPTPPIPSFSRMTEEPRASASESGPLVRFLLVSLVAAVAFWVWGIATGSLIAYIFAVVWTLMAGMPIWRLTHGGEPIFKPK